MLHDFGEKHFGFENMIKSIHITCREYKSAYSFYKLHDDMIKIKEGKMMVAETL